MKLNRENKLLIGLCTAALILIAKLFSIQIVDDKYKLAAENNSLAYTTIYPNRGIIHDRNGKILVGNKVSYDLMVTPREVEPFDTIDFCRILDVSPDFVKEKMKEYRLVVWGMHGIYGAGRNMDEAFGLIETVEKAAQLYMLTAHLPRVNTIRDNELAAVADAFGLNYRKDFLDL